MKVAPYLLLTALRNPESALSLGLEDWDLLVRQARRADLLARLCVLLGEQGLLDEVHLQARNHLESELLLAKTHERVVRWEGRKIHQALEDFNIPVILLKGAAYVLGALPTGRGRLFNDVDILVPKRELDTVEKALIRRGWMLTDTRHQAFSSGFPSSKCPSPGFGKRQIATSARGPELAHELPLQLLGQS